MRIELATVCVNSEFRVCMHIVNLFYLYAYLLFILQLCFVFGNQKPEKAHAVNKCSFLTSALIMVTRISVQYVSQKLKFVAFPSDHLSDFLIMPREKKPPRKTSDKGVVNHICRITIRSSWVAIGQWGGEGGRGLVGGGRGGRGRERGERGDEGEGATDAP